jgi:DNA-binding NarL/FixJ family response regulator
VPPVPGPGPDDARRPGLPPGGAGAGCAGYVLKAAAHTELIAAIRQVAAGRTFVDPQLAGDLLQALAGPERAAPQPAPERPEGRLSERERAS